MQESSPFLQPTIPGPDLSPGIADTVGTITGAPTALFEFATAQWFIVLGQFVWAVVILVIGYAIYHVWLMNQYNKIEVLLYDTHPEEGPATEISGKMSKQWREIQKHIQGTKDNDWKIAILEADTLLDQLLIDLGHPGTTLGERLKSIDRGEMTTLSDAWEAHKVRNRIAHDGSNFELSYQVAKQTVDRFEKVFREFDYI